ncbi:pirin family protein [Sphingobacterium sp. UT-1RO-CII-1]|uniref:pirin family protein n=1 Tax=Sphingobacterium sp. UT-1RO-CII-1 TaxID=2995225 RepID=UPI00227B676C|nr:pirin family protein [Sphingobacterium sp. UT-1RO-CII-1]MCY4781526.1 pirin family protein [Sphingobacterium sp. UT-1RO-CII-1]
MATRKIERIVKPSAPHFVGDGFRVHNFIPGAAGLDQKRMNPFILMDYNSKFYFPPTDTPRGVGVHPHRGFETVTIAYKGRVAHGDSSGGGGVIAEGDVQWMTAASGVLHKEYHEETFSKEGGDFHMVQLWVNLPAKDKMSTPKYQGIRNADIAKYDLPNEGGYVEVIAGNYKDVLGSASTFTPLYLLNLRLNKGGEVPLSFSTGFNTALLVVEGSIRVNNEEDVPTDHLVLFENNAEEFTVTATADAVVLVMSGEPIDEPIVSYGPFVMNTQEEIVQAMEDFQAGKFGRLED